MVLPLHDQVFGELSVPSRSLFDHEKIHLGPDVYVRAKDIIVPRQKTLHPVSQIDDLGNAGDDANGNQNRFTEGRHLFVNCRTIHVVLATLLQLTRLPIGPRSTYFPA